MLSRDSLVAVSSTEGADIGHERENKAAVPVYSYQVLFPPGPHGLELEPVIKSSERSIGCRVKGFYFSLEHEGIDRVYLESVVEPGDVLCSIDGLNVLSMNFDSILALLKTIRTKERIIVLKNISASCKLLN